MSRTNQPAEVYPIRRLNRWFALAALCLLVTTVWLIRVDHDRPWKHWQRSFFELEHRRLSLQHGSESARLERGAKAAELEALQRNAERARAELLNRRDDIQKQQRIVRDLRDQHLALQRALNRRKAELADLRYSAEVKGERGEADAATALQRFRAAEREVRKLDDQLAERQASLLRAEASLDAASLEQRQAQRAVDRAREQVTELEERLAGFDDGLFDSVLRDAPLLDFINPRLEVRQVVLPDVRDDFGFATVQKEDRCITCHMGIDRKPYKRHPNSGRFLVAETRAAHEAQLWAAARRALSDLLDGVARDDALDDFGAFEKKAKWSFEAWAVDAVEPDGHRAELLLRTRALRAQLERQASTFGAHPQLDAWVGNSSPHPLESFGCTVCHEGLGHSTDFVRSAHTPNDEPTGERWREAYDWQPPPYWERPQLPQKHLTASCASCHQGEVKIAGATAYNRGRREVEQLGCFGCHTLDGSSETLRPVGPSLERVASKYDDASIYRWLWKPRAARAATRMPRFFEQSNNARPEFVARTQQEVRGVVAYLRSKSLPFEVPPMPEGGDAMAGEKLFTEVGCLGCHSVRAKGWVANEHGPDLSGIGALLQADWIYAWTYEPSRYFPETRMPSMRLSEAEARDITRFLETLREPGPEAMPIPVRDSKLQAELLHDALQATLPRDELNRQLANMDADTREAKLGELVIGKYGCTACHAVPGFEAHQPIGPELNGFASKPKAWLDFALIPAAEIPRTRIRWSQHKLGDPRIYDRGKTETKRFSELLRMPNFELTAQQNDSLVTFLLSRQRADANPRRQRRLDDADEAVQVGRRLAREHNCYGCHYFDGEGGALALYWKFDSDGGTAHFAPQPVPPDFDFVTHVPDPVRPFVAPMLLDEGNRVQPRWLFGYLKAPSMVRPALPMRMPSFGFDDGEANTLVRMFTGLEGDLVAYHSSYQPQPERVGIGRQMFVRGQCTRCHLHDGRDLRAEQVPRGLIAPDLKRVHARLQPDWVPSWLHDPQKILPGTKMASFFDQEQGSTILDPDGSLLDGDLDEGTRALRDFLMASPE